jgi:hypothetical protein
MLPVDYDILIDPPTETLDQMAQGFYRCNRSILGDAGHIDPIRYAAAAHSSSGQMVGGDFGELP